jgi:hypothetical protein
MAGLFLKVLFKSFFQAEFDTKIRLRCIGYNVKDYYS